MKSFFIFVIVICFSCPIPAFSFEVPDFDFPDSGKTTFNDWNSASAIVQMIQPPKIPAQKLQN